MTARRPEPFFSQESAFPQPRGRLLVLSYHFPPAQAAGALRWEKLAAFAAERGWGLDVVTLDPGCLPAADWPRLVNVAAAIRVYGVPRRLPLAERLEQLLWNAYRRLQPPGHRHTGPSRRTRSSDNDALAQAGLVPREQLRWRVTALWDHVRALEAWLDFAREGSWSRAAGATALRLAQPGVHRAIVTCGPPHMVHLAGRFVSRRTGLPLVMDMRDPWSLNPAVPESLANPLWFWLAARHERSAVRHAALVITNTAPFRIAMQAVYPRAHNRIITVLNGCDEEPIPPAPVGRRFTIAYAGSIYLDRNPRLVFRAAARVVRELELTPEQLGFDFLGYVEGFGGVPLGVMAREEGVGDYVRTYATRPRREAMTFLAQAAMLLSLPQDTPLAIPSKLFEYLQFNAWLLVLAKRDSAIELLLRGTGADIVEPQNVDGMVEVLRTRYLQFTAGERPTRVVTNGRFSRRAQAHVLLDALERCIERGDSRATEA